MNTQAFVETSPALTARRKQQALASGARRFASEFKKAAGHSVLDPLRVVARGIQQARLRRARVARIRQYLGSHPVAKLHLGSGPVSLPGWLNADLRPRQPGHIFMNVLERFPFANDTFAYVASEHLIGDLDYYDCGSMLRECYRILQPGGRIRLATPDLERLTTLYSPARSPEQEHYLRWAIENNAVTADIYAPGLAINTLFDEYEFLYDRQTLGHLLEVAGFAEITTLDAGVSGDPELTGLDAHGKVLGDHSVNSFESLTIEAVKPRAGARRPVA